MTRPPKKNPYAATLNTSLKEYPDIGRKFIATLIKVFFSTGDIPSCQCPRGGGFHLLPPSEIQSLFLNTSYTGQYDYVGPSVWGQVIRSVPLYFALGEIFCGKTLIAPPPLWSNFDPTPIHSCEISNLSLNFLIWSSKIIPFNTKNKEYQKPVLS